MSEQKKDIASVTTEIYKLLSSFETEDRQKIVTAALTLLGDVVPSLSKKSSDSGKSADQRKDDSELSEKEFFEQKQPNSKIEELATAARYREEYLDCETHTKEELQQIIKNARRNFDAKNFARDLENAKIKGLFTRDREIKLSYVGQGHIDTLPDRSSLKAKANKKKVKKSNNKAQ